MTSPVEVKALEWCDEDRGTIAYPDIGEYRIEDQGKNWTEDRYWFSYAGRVIQKYGTIEAAKAAAQAHHDRIILSRILPSTEVERLREALKPFAEEADEWNPYAEDEILVEYWPNGPTSILTVQHLRAARAALRREHGL